MFVHFFNVPTIAPLPIKQKTVDFNKLAKFGRNLEKSIVAHLGKKDLAALDVTLMSTKSTNKTHWESAVKEATKLKELQADLAEIFTDHPTWKGIAEGWNGVSLEDKVWLLRLYELHQLPRTDTSWGMCDPSITLPQISAFFPNQADQTTHQPSLRTPELLNCRAEIEKILDQKEALNVNGTQLKKCPKAICLLKNLKEMDLSRNELEVPPDVSKNTKLETLYLKSNNLEKAPDVSQNPNLKYFYMTHNQLKAPPNVSRNPKLEQLGLSHNLLREHPYVRNNRHLESLYLETNLLTTAPDVSQCPKLRDYRIKGIAFSKEVKLEIEALRFTHPGLRLYLN